MNSRPAPEDLIRRIDALLPQTQCTRCGYDDCRAYAEAIASGQADINRCPPGGEPGIQQLAALTGRPPQPLDTTCGVHTPLQQALIDESWCIGCTLCIQACPVDCIVGSHKQMHTVIAAQCTGCELCLPVCPVDCISMAPAATPSWTEARALQARQRYEATTTRRARARIEHAEQLESKARHKLAHLETLTKANDDGELQRKRQVIEAALARSRAQRGQRS
jgi:electron transport complex protein RnfB